MPPRPLPTIAGTVRAVVKGTTPQGIPWSNIWHWRYSGGASNPGLNEVTNLDPIFLRMYTGTAYTGGTAYMLNVGNGWKLVEIDYLPLDGSSTGWTFPHPLTTVTGAGTPAEICCVLTTTTGLRGRRYRGRVYLPAPTQANLNTDGTLQSSLPTSTVAQFNGMLAAAAAIQWKPVVASYGHGSYQGNPTTWTPFATDITGCRMDQFADVQRRRKGLP